MNGHARTDSRYWLDKLQLGTSKEYGVQMYFQGKRHRFALSTSKKNEAAKKAANIFNMLQQVGWKETIAYFKPHTVKPEDPTFGEVFEAVKGVSTIKSVTVIDYIKSARNIVASITGMDKDNSRFSPHGGNAKWIAKIDAINLSAVTPTKVRSWRDRFILDKSNGNPESDKGHSAKVSSNSLLRQARSIFGGGCLSKLKDQGVKLPNPLPFHDLSEKENPILSKLESKRLRYKSRVDFQQLVLDAQDELANDEEKQNEWLIFLLCGLAGLRKNEADKLLWSQIDTQAKIISIHNHKYFTAKTASSQDEINLDVELSSILQGYKARAQSQFVLDSHIDADLKRKGRYYRCNKDFKKLIVWLRTKGMTERKAIHALRKEIASHLYKEDGIDAASKFLRHSDTTTTQRFYADPNKRKQTSGLGHLLNDKIRTL